MKNTNKKTRKTSKARKTLTASVAALMLATTAANIGASAFPMEPWGFESYRVKASTTAEDYVKYQLDGKKYKDVLDAWKKAMKDPTKAFEKGNDINGDGVVTKEETDQVSEKIREYAAAMTAGIIKMGLSVNFPGSQFVADKPLGDLTNALFGVKQKASNEDVIKQVNKSTQELISKINEAEEKIVTRTANISVASKYGQVVDEFTSGADIYRKSVNEASSEGTKDEKAVAVALNLGSMKNWADKDIVEKMGYATYYFTSDYCTTDSENGSNIYDIAMRTAIDKGSLFMKEAVENSQQYIIKTTGKYLKSCLTVLEMLSSMQKVSQLTPEQVAAMSKSAQDDYKEIAAHADKAYACEVDILNDLAGEDGILSRTSKYIQRKETEPTTYVGRGLNNFVQLENFLDYRENLTFVEAYQNRTIRAGYDWRWVKGYEDYMIKRGGLSYSEIEGICKHAFALRYNVENYLKQNGFDVDKNATSGKTRVMPTGFYDDDRGSAFRGYNSDLGFKGYKTKTGYSKDSGAEKFKSICKVHEPFYVPLVWEIRNEDNNDIYAFFVQKGKAGWIEGSPEPA